MFSLSNARTLVQVLAAAAMSAAFVQCAKEESPPPNESSAGSGGDGASGGASGDGATGGEGASAGSGEGGSAGSGGAGEGGSAGAGAGGSSGDAGMGGGGSGGLAGEGGSSGEGASSGEGGSGAAAGSSGSGGMAGESGSSGSGGSDTGPTKTFGFVRDTTTSVGIESAAVSFGLLETLGSGRFQVAESRSAVTLGSGYFSIDDVKQGWQRISVAAPGYTPRLFYRNHHFRTLCAGIPCAAQNFFVHKVDELHEKLPDLIPDARQLRYARLTNACDDRNDISMCLRTGIVIANIGEGDLWMTAPTDALNVVTQHVDRTDSSIADVPLPNAHFIHHKEHGHIHFDGWSGFALRAIDETCETEANAENCRVIRMGDKISFCLRDSLVADTSLAATRSYDCAITDGRVSQGIGSGKSDLYDASLKGQIIDVGGLPHGDYWFEVYVNAEKVAVESDLTNNVARTRITLELPECGNRVIEPPESCEGADLDGMTCLEYSPRYSGGKLACNATCGFDRSGCERAACAPTVIGRAVGANVATGSNANLFDTRDTFLCENPKGTGRDASFLWTAPSGGKFRIDTDGSSYDTMLYVFNEDCAGEELVCDSTRGDSEVTLEAIAGRSYVIVVDAHPGRIGTYNLNITGPI